MQDRRAWFLDAAINTAVIEGLVLGCSSHDTGQVRMVRTYALLSTYREQKVVTLVTSSIIRQCGSLGLSLLEVIVE
jgi:hypothetical protein